MVGLLNKDQCTEGEILILLPCKSIHTFGMKERIDVAFLDKHGRVLKAIRALPPRRLSSCDLAVCVLERRWAPDSSWFEENETVRLLQG